MKHERGFTLPEVLFAGVFMIVAIAVMLVMLRPHDYGAEHRNAQRRLGLARMMVAIQKYDDENKKLPPNLHAEETIIANDETDDNLCKDLVPKYLDDLPFDPSTNFRLISGDSCASEDQLFITGYTARVEGGNVILTAPSAEGGEKITIEKWFSYL